LNSSANALRPLALEVLDEGCGPLALALVVGDGHVLDGGELRGGESSVAGDHGGPSVAGRLHEERLDQALGGDRCGEALEALGLHRGTGIEALGDVDLRDLESRGGHGGHL
jgi:hypothetical protein